MANKQLSDYTEKDFLDLINSIIEVDFATEAEHSEAVYLFNQLSEYPTGHDLIYRPEVGADSSPQGILDTVKKWRAENGKPGFKSA